jgi:hypothetical protein
MSERTIIEKRVFMDSILTQVGLLAIAIFIIYIIKKLDGYFDDKKTGTNLSDKVYRAAKAFSQGESADEMRNILMNCIDFDGEDIEEVIALAFPHRTDSDGGYNAFIEAVNKVLAI